MERTPYTVVVEQPADEPAQSPLRPAAAPSRAPLPQASGPRTPHLEEWIAIPQYPEHRARVWLNFPQRLMNEVNSGDQRRIGDALTRIVLEHNGWCDEEGTPYPAAADTRFWEAIPLHLAAAVMRALQQKATEAPLAPPTRRG